MIKIADALDVSLDYFRKRDDWMTTRLKVLRAEHDLTQAELAEALGTTQKVISSWETGRVNPRPAMMQKVEDFFQVPKEEIFFTAFNHFN